MKTLTFTTKVMAFAAIIFLFQQSGCNRTPDDQKQTIKLTGTVVDTEGKAIEKGKIVVYAFTSEIKEPKRFEFDIDQGKLNQELPQADKYVVNIHVRGYGLVSKVFYHSIPERSYQLKEATVIPFNPSIGGLIRDSKNNCIGSLSAQANWTGDPWKELPLRINSSGQIAGFGMSPELESAYNYHAKSKPCNNGITVNIPANSLTTTANVNVSMSAIDLFSIDGMPGDYSLSIDQSRVGFMESYGAFSLEIYEDKENFNLNDKEKKSAQVTFPIAGIVKKDEKLPESIPVVYYDEVNGVWKKETEARLDRDMNAYVAEVFHFSAINLDLEKVNTSCLTFIDPSETPTDAFVAPYRVEVTAPPTSPGGMPRVSSRTVAAADICTAPANQFALTRLPAETELSVAFFDNTTAQPKGVYVFKTGVANSALQVTVPEPHPTCTELVATPGICGTVKPIQTNDFAQPAPEIFIAACKNTVTNNLIVSIATAPSVGTLALANYKIKVSRSSGGSPDCQWVSPGNLTTLTLVSDNSANVPPPNIKVLQFSIPFGTALCNPMSSYGDEKIELVDATTTTSVVSNAFNLVNCN